MVSVCQMFSAHVDREFVYGSSIVTPLTYTILALTLIYLIANTLFDRRNTLIHYYLFIGPLFSLSMVLE
jgi:hypothetical protein